MSFEYHCNILPHVHVHQIHNLIQQHVIVYPPPWSFDCLLQSLTIPNGRPLTLVVNYNSRNVSVVEQSITHHVIQTTVQAFQRHRLSQHRNTTIIRYKRPKT
jgi:hypothetical protein